MARLFNRIMYFSIPRSYSFDHLLALWKTEEEEKAQQKERTNRLRTSFLDYFYSPSTYRDPRQRLHATLKILRGRRLCKNIKTRRLAAGYFRDCCMNQSRHPLFDPAIIDVILRYESPYKI